MRIETILNNCQKFKSFVYKSVNWVIHNGEKCLEVIVVPRKNGHAICSGCHKVAKCYDTQKPRWFEFVPLWGYKVIVCEELIVKIVALKLKKFHGQQVSTL